MGFEHRFSTGADKINPRDTLIFYIDVMPSETINHANTELHLALVCAICGDTKRIKEEFNQFKATRGNHRKIKAARRLREIINGEEFDIRLLTSIITVKDVRILGAGLLNNLAKNIQDLKKDGEYWIFDGGKRIHSRVALVCPWYAFTLVAFAPFAAKMCENLSYQNFSFVLDPIPGDVIENLHVRGLEFLNFIFSKSPLLKKWKSVIEKHKIANSGFGYIGIPTGPNSRLPAKNEGEAILADWLCQSVHAAVNYQWYVAESENRTEEFRKEIASICFDLKESGIWINLPVGLNIFEAATDSPQTRIADVN